MKEPEAELPSPREAPPEAAAEAATWKRTWLLLREEVRELETQQELEPPADLASSHQPELKLAWQESEQALEDWANNLWAGLAELRKGVKHLMSPNAAGQRQTVKDAERSMRTFKAQQSGDFERLLAEQRHLEDALASLEKRFDSWIGVLPSASSQSRTKGASSKEKGSDEPRGAASLKAILQDDPELQQLKSELKMLEDTEAQVQGGGNGGWSAADHEVFVRILRIFRMQATPQCYARLAYHFPDLSEATLADHVRWYSDHQARQARRRLLLVRWRERRSTLLSQASQSRNETPVREPRDRSRDEQRRRVQAWREAREEEESRLAAAQRQIELEQARQEKKRQKQHQKKLKEFAEAYRKQRDEEKRQAAQQLSAQASQRALSEEDRQRIVQRNLAMLTKKLQAAPRCPTPQTCQRSHAYDHVKSRLHDPTRSFAQKTAPKEDESQ